MISPLIIDPEFESKIPPLTDEEFQQLEENILADSGVINPLIIWNGILIDGHNAIALSRSTRTLYTIHTP